MGAQFTYQEQLNKNGSPITDDCSMAFRLYDSETEDTALGVLTQTVHVDRGLFAAELDTLAARPLRGPRAGWECE